MTREELADKLANEVRHLAYQALHVEQFAPVPIDDWWLTYADWVLAHHDEIFGTPQVVAINKDTPRWRPTIVLSDKARTTTDEHFKGNVP